MEDNSKKFVPELPPFLNRPPVSPKPFTITPLPTTVLVASGSRDSRWHQMQPYFTNHSEAASSQTKSHLESFKGKAPIPPPPSRNPIKSVTPSIDNHGGITVKTELGIDYEMKLGRVDPKMDDRKLRRILSNRISAQKSRTRKVHYLNGLERKKKDLEVQIAMFTPLIESEQEKNKQLQMENHFLKERIRSCEALIESEQEKNKQQQMENHFLKERIRSCEALIESEQEKNKQLQMENHFLKERISSCEALAKLSIAMVEENRKVTRTLKEVLYAAQQNFYMQLQEEPSMLVGGSNTHEQMMVMEDSTPRSDEPKPMVEDKALNFTSLTIDPPSNLHVKL